MKDGPTKHDLVSPYGIYEILTEATHAQRQPMIKLRIGSAGKTGPYATLNISTQTIDGVVGKKSRGGGDPIIEEQWIN